MSSIKKSVRFEKELHDEIVSYQKVHRLSYFAEALHARDRDREQRIRELESENQKRLSIFDYMKKALSPNQPLENHISTVKEAPKSIFKEFSEKLCHFVVYVNKNPNCANPDAPISPYLKRHLTAQICAICQELMKKALEEAKQKEEEKHRKALEKTKEQTKKYAKRINESSETWENQRTVKPFPSEEFGMCGY